MVVVQELIAKDVDASELDFSRYGDTFFEVGLIAYFSQLTFPAARITLWVRLRTLKMALLSVLTYHLVHALGCFHWRAQPAGNN
jgi:hypothetical protein